MNNFDLFSWEHGEWIILGSYETFREAIRESRRIGFKTWATDWAIAQQGSVHHRRLTEDRTNKISGCLPI